MNFYLGMALRFEPVDGRKRVEIVVPYSAEGAGSEVVVLGFVERRRGRWRATTASDGVVGTRFKLRRDAVAALYAQRFGNPDMPRRRTHAKDG